MNYKKTKVICAVCGVFIFTHSEVGPILERTDYKPDSKIICENGHLNIPTTPSHSIEENYSNSISQNGPNGVAISSTLATGQGNLGELLRNM